jgi:hypothetical protein
MTQNKYTNWNVVAVVVHVYKENKKICENWSQNFDDEDDFFFWRKSRSKYHSGFLCTVKKNHPHHQNFEISFHRFFVFFINMNNNGHNIPVCVFILCHQFDSTLLFWFAGERKNYPGCLFHELLFLIFLVSFFCEQTIILLLPPILFSISFFFWKKHSIFVRIIWKLIS